MSATPDRRRFQRDQGEGTLGYDDHGLLEKWAPECPDGNPQRLCEILGFRLKGADYLQLRVVLGGLDRGVCQAIVEEHPDRVYVRALACLHEDESACNAPRLLSDEVDCPCNVWLDAPLDERIVIDVDSGRPLPLFVPGWGTGERSVYVPRPSGSLWPRLRPCPTRTSPPRIP